MYICCLLVVCSKSSTDLFFILILGIILIVLLTKNEYLFTKKGRFIMKNIFYIGIVIFSLAFVQNSKAQVSVNINVGSQPLWGPVGYDYARYYYMPEINVYYNVNNKKYTYRHGNKWLTKSRLPGRYRNFDVYRTYKVVINENDPWNRHQHYHNAYARHAHNHSQIVIRDGRRSSRGSANHVYHSRGKEHKKHKDNKGNRHNNRNNKKHDYHGRR